MKKTLFSLFLLLSVAPMWAQTDTLVASELTDTKSHDGNEVWARVPGAVQMAWGSTDVRYAKMNVPRGRMAKSLRLDA